MQPMSRPARTPRSALVSAGYGRATPRRLGILLLGLGLATMVLPDQGAHGAPIGIRARTRVTVTYRVDAQGLLVTGRLVDDIDAPVVGEDVAFELAVLPVALVKTDADGRFEARFARHQLVAAESTFGAELPWTFTFDGNSQLGPVRELGTFDLSKRATRITLGLPPTRIALGEKAVEVVVTLTEVGGASPVPVPDAEVAVEVGTGSELVGTTGRLGTATFVVRPGSLAAAGRYGVVARFKGDLERGPSRADGAIDVILPSRVSLRIVREGDEVSGRYRFSGRLSDELGPIPDAVVNVVGTVDPSQPDAPGFERAVATRADGLFVTAISAEEMAAIRLAAEARADPAVGGTVRLEVTASFVPADGVHAGTSSHPIALEIPPPPGIPLRWYALALGLVLGLVLTLRGLRSGRLQRALAAAWARLRGAWDAVVRGLRNLGLVLRGRARPTAAATPSASVAGLSPLASSRDSRRIDFLAGQVIDLDTRTPIEAELRARRGPGESVHVVASAGEDGRFELGPLPSGPWLVEVSSAGYLPREVVVEVPHGGDFDGVLLGLVEIRRTVREVFQETVQALGAPSAWGFDTPRETARGVMAAAQARAPAESTAAPDALEEVADAPLGELVDLVERAHFARRLATAADVDRARALQLELRPLRSERAERRP